MIIEDSGKYYLIEDGKVVKAAASKEELQEAVETLKTDGYTLVPQADLAEFEKLLGEPVRVKDKLGRLVAATPSMYGYALAVEFEDGSVDEFAPEEVESVPTETPVFANRLDEIRHAVVEYRKMPAYTEEELNEQLAEGRKINLMARSIMRGEKLASGELFELDQIATETQIDIDNAKASRELLRESAGEDYLKQFNQYKLDETFHYAPTLGSNSDASWLGDIEDVDVAEASDGDLATRATEMVAHFNREQLADDEFLQEAVNLQRGYLNLSGDRLQAFTNLVESARNEKLAEPEPEVKQAAAEESLDDFDTTSIYLPSA